MEVLTLVGLKTALMDTKLFDDRTSFDTSNSVLLEYNKAERIYMGAIIVKDSLIYNVHKKIANTPYSIINLFIHVDGNKKYNLKNVVQEIIQYCEQFKAIKGCISNGDKLCKI